MISIKNIEKSFDKRILFSDLSFEVDNTILVISGKSGCGKSTLLRIIAGFDADYMGKLCINNIEMSSRISPKNRDVAIVFQEPTLWKHMSVVKNIEYAMSMKDKERIESVSRILGILDILNRYPEEISGGEAKRVSLARAILSDKSNILLDEPLANVDNNTKYTILSYLLSEYVIDKSLIYVTHDNSEIDELNCKRIEL